MTDYVEVLKSGGSHHSNPTPLGSSVSVDRSLLQLEEDGFRGARPGLLVNRVGGDGHQEAEESRRGITPGKPAAKSSSGFGGLKKGLLSGGGGMCILQHLHTIHANTHDFKCEGFGILNYVLLIIIIIIDNV